MSVECSEVEDGTVDVYVEVDWDDDMVDEGAVVVAVDMELEEAPVVVEVRSTSVE